MISRGSAGLFHRAILQSGVGPWALEQKSLAAAEADGEAFAAKAGCPDQTADCLRRLPVADLVSNQPGAAVPAVVDGAVLEEPIGTALAAGRFARVPILNGTNHDEERLFVDGFHLAVTGAVVPVPQPVTAESYQRVIASVLGVPAARAAAIAAEYPLEAYPSPTVAVSALVSDASFACPALQLDLLTSKYVPTFAYEFNDDNSPLRYPPTLTGPRRGHTQVRVPIPVRPAGRAVPGTVQPRPAGTRGQHASGLGELRGQRQPVHRGRALARVRRGQHADAVARAATAAGRDGLRRQAPLRVLGRRVTTPASGTGTTTATSPVADHGRSRSWPRQWLMSW